jgi:orotate phosphoribosyltransferase
MTSILPHIFQYVESTDKAIAPYVFDISKLADNPRYMREFISYVKTVPDFTNVDKLASVISLESIASYPLLVELSINMNIPYVVITSSIPQKLHGSLKIGDELILIVDKIVDVAEFLAMVKKLERMGAIIKTILVILDNEDGKLEELAKSAYNIKSLFYISAVIENLLNRQNITTYQYEKIANYVNLQKTAYIKSLEDAEIPQSADPLPTEKYPQLLQNILRSAIITLIAEKQTALCLSIDVGSWEKAKELIALCGSYICMIKLNVGAFGDIVSISEFKKELRQLANSYRFFILEDSGIHGVAKHVWERTNTSHFEIASWASFITVAGNIEKTLEHWHMERDKSPLVVCPIIQDSYSVPKLAISKSIAPYELIAPLVITQTSPEIKNLLKLTPNIILEKHVPTGAKFRSIEDAIVRDENHIVIMGNAIYKGFNETEIMDNVVEASRESWRCFNDAYEHLVDKVIQYKTDFAETRKKLEKIHEKNLKQIVKLEKKRTVEESGTLSKGAGTNLLNRISSIGSFMRRKKTDL